MAPSVTVSLQPPAVSALAGGEATIRVTVRNRGQGVGQYLLGAEGIDPAWVVFEPDQVSAFPDEEATAQMRLRPPQNVPPATYPVTVVVHNLDDAPEQTRAAATLTVSAPAGEPQRTPPTAAPVKAPAAPTPVSAAAISATAAPAEAPVLGIPALRAASPGAGQLELTCDRDGLMLLAGAQGRLNLSLHNAGGTSLTVELSTRGFPASWLSLGMASVSLAPGRTASTALTLSPVAQAPAGSYPLTIAAQAREDAATAAHLDLVIEIAESGGLVVQIDPSQADGQANAAYRVQVTQTASAPLRVRLSAADSQGACSYVFDPEVVVVPAAGSVTSRLTVTARRGITGGDAATYVFTVSVVGVDSGAAISQGQGRFVQRRPPALSVILEPPESRGPAQAAYVVRAANHSQIETSLSLSASDPKGACTCQIAPASLRLAPGAEAIARLTVAALAYQAGAEEVVHTFTLLAQPGNSLLEPAKAEGRFIQTAMALPGLTLTPSSQMSAGAASFTLRVQNPRSEPVKVSLSASDEMEACRFAIAPQEMLLPAGGQGTARLTVTPRAGLLAGESQRVNAFRVSALASDLPIPAVVQGSLVQARRGGVGKWLPWVLALLALLLAAAAAALLLFPRGDSPLPTSTPVRPRETSTTGPDMVGTAKAVQAVTQTAIARATLDQQNAETAVAQATLAAQNAATAAAKATQVVQNAATAAAKAAADRQTATAQVQQTKTAKDGQATGTALAQALGDAQATAAAAQTKAAAPTKPPAVSPTALPALMAIIAHPTSGEYQPAATTQLTFEVHAWNPMVGTADGAGITNVDMRIINSANVVVHQRAEGTASYCVFGGGEPNCTIWVFADHGKKWPSGQAIVAGTYTLQAIVHAADGRSRTVSTTVKIQP